MKITIDIPDKTCRQAKTLAVAEGISVKQLLTEAIEDKVRLAKKSENGRNPLDEAVRCFRQIGADA